MKCAICYTLVRLEKLMRIDLYTKTILTLIALLLAVVALGPLVQPQPVAAQSPFAGTQFSASATAQRTFGQLIRRPEMSGYTTYNQSKSRFMQSSLNWASRFSRMVGKFLRARRCGRWQRIAARNPSVRAAALVDYLKALIS